MLNLEFEKINKESIQILVDNQHSEDKHLEYKEKINVVNDKEKKELLYDISSFANALGGYIIYGIKETKGIPVEIVGIRDVDIDSEILKIDSLASDSIAPRINGLRLKEVKIDDSRSVLVIKIPKSWNAPHQVTFKGTDKFYSRNNAGKYRLDIFEIKNAFLLNNRLDEKLNKFKLKRISEIVSGDGIPKLMPSGKIVLHVIPVNSFQNDESVNLEAISEKKTYLENISGSPNSYHFNFDGYISYSGPFENGEHNGYQQLFRNGIIEFVDSQLLSYTINDEYFLPSVKYEERIIKVVKNSLELFKSSLIDPPIILSLSLINVRNYKLAIDTFRFNLIKHPIIDRENLFLTDLLLDSYEFVPEKILQRWFNSIWNAAGLKKCYNYDKEGNWRPHDRRN